ncbi:hypothetical protein A3F66_01260 [candidate division TM6 bacterium RIFCSPHIGHO2_12_FULL_32_22]|nr:MAG: hypothetical protein A3F66_01260 [candidate division TM6 bacterium RIFCSPHIGHO2_12_FULL_32_22]
MKKLLASLFLLLSIMVTTSEVREFKLDAFRSRGASTTVREALGINITAGTFSQVAEVAYAGLLQSDQPQIDADIVKRRSGVLSVFQAIRGGR